jgi:hypothetical protein
MNISIFTASTLMLSLWHIDASVVKQLNYLEKASSKQVYASKQDEMVLFMLSCVYVFATGQQDYSELEQKAQALNYTDFKDIKAALFGV